MYPNGSGKTRRNNLNETQKSNFVNDMVSEINCIYENWRKRADKEKVDFQIYFRIHESGDYYDIYYFKKWIQITDKFIA